MLPMAVHPTSTPALSPRARVSPPRPSTSLAATSSSPCSRIVSFKSRRLPLRSVRSVVAAAAAAAAEEEENKVVVPERQDPMLVLKFIWMEKNIGIALDQLVPGYGSIPLSPYYFWPRKDAWEELRAKLEEKEWISQKQMIILLNQATDIINLWQQGGGSLST
ncbi:30S ribosomal protein 3, chloroplastic [Zea mays]|uniref:30S ribosomal protein 3, chloroplastic n=1 Tax=Zea mays TaxID=4577 RepID=A0A3L6G211_MAIZE|nr:30S ribosomal protein 3, chloroplastic [Zea mays]